jgi:HK97 family phage major capsid protein
MNKNLRELNARKAKHVAAMRAITDKAAKESRDLTEAEATEFDKEKAALATTNAAISREQELIEAERSAGVEVSDDAAISGGAPRAEADPRRGFRSFGEFLGSVRRAGANFANPGDERLTIGAAAPSTFGNEAGGVDGGFLIPPEFSQQIFQLSLGEDSLLPMTDNTEVSSNGMVFPKDETTPWGTDGVRAYWQAEATAANATKPKFGTQALRLHKLMALTPVTDELLADSSAIEGYLSNLFARSIRWKTNEALLLGTGAGQPMGAFTNAGNTGSCAVVQAKDSGQATLTVTVGNVTNMIARLPPGSYGRAVWLITPDALPLVFQLTLGSYPIWMPTGSPTVGGVQLNPYGNLLGRPIIVSQHSPAFTSQGDISLVDMSYYRTITRAGMGAMRTDSSMHLYFDADATAFRALFRIDGQPKIVAPIAQAKGSKTLSPFIQLAAR